MIELLHGLYEDEAHVFALTLSSAGIPHTVVKSDEDEFGLWVEREDVNRAIGVIREYMAENRDEDTAEAAPSDYEKSWAGIWGAVGLLIFYAMTAVGELHKGFVQMYGSSASRVLDGELWRTVTALMLHSDEVHLVGNMVGIAIFGSAVCGLTGWGMGAGLILLSGVLGNLANAMFYETRHVSIGASTAVFGALGIVVAHQVFNKIKHRRQRIKAWLPLAGGLALLAILGSGAGSDIMAHLFGFLFGILLGFGYVFMGRRPKRTWQFAVFGLFLVVVVGSWVAPIIHS